MRRPRRILYAEASDEDVASTKIIQHGITIVKSSSVENADRRDEGSVAFRAPVL